MPSPEYTQSIGVIDAFRKKKAALKAVPGNLTKQNAATQPVSPGPYAQGRVNTGGGLSMTSELDTPGMRRALGQQPSVAGVVGMKNEVVNPQTGVRLDINVTRPDLYKPPAGYVVQQTPVAATPAARTTTSGFTTEDMLQAAAQADKTSRRLEGYSGGRLSTRINPRPAIGPDGTEIATTQLRGNWTTTQPGQERKVGEGVPAGEMDAAQFARANPHLVKYFSPERRAAIERAVGTNLPETATSKQAAAYQAGREQDLSGRRSAVQANAAARGDARRARLAGRAAGPSVADAVLARVAQDDPVAAAQLYGLHNTRAAQLALEQQRMQQEGELGRGKLDVERDRNKAELARYGREDSVKFGELAQQAEANAMAAREAGDFNAYRRYLAEAEGYRRQALGGAQPGEVPGAPAQAAGQAGQAAPNQPAAPRTDLKGWARVASDDTLRQEFESAWNGANGAVAARDLLRNRGFSDEEITQILNERSSQDNFVWDDRFRTAEDPSWSGAFWNMITYPFSGGGQPAAPQAAPPTPAPAPPAAPPSVAGAVTQTSAQAKPKAKPKELYRGRPMGRLF